MQGSAAPATEHFDRLDVTAPPTSLVRSVAVFMKKLTASTILVTVTTMPCCVVTTPRRRVQRARRGVAAAGGVQGGARWGEGVFGKPPVAGGLQRPLRVARGL